MKRPDAARLAFAALLLPVLAFAEGAAVEQAPEMSRLEAYRYDPALTLEDRIGPPPPGLLEEYRKMDGRPDYRGYSPSAEEKKLVVDYLRMMPPAVERIFREKCAGLYFVSGFTGNGMTSWVADSSGTLYFSMVLNPAALTQSLSETLTEREKSCFIPAEGWAVSVDAGKKYRGLAYALFHEAAHAVDYIKGLTPFVEPGMPDKVRAPFRGDGGLFTGAWKDYSLPKKKNDYAGRRKITFYGLGGGPRLGFAGAPELYKGLLRSPFISLYGSRSWAEDLSELVAYGLITGKLGQPYRITLSSPGSEEVLEPMAGRSAARAAAAVELLEKI